MLLTYIVQAYAAVKMTHTSYVMPWYKLKWLLCISLLKMHHCPPSSYQLFATKTIGVNKGVRQCIILFFSPTLSSLQSCINCNTLPISTDTYIFFLFGSLVEFLHQINTCR